MVRRWLKRLLGRATFTAASVSPAAAGGEAAVVQGLRELHGELVHGVAAHHDGLDNGLATLLDTAQYQDVVKQIVDRLEPALQARQAVVEELTESQQAKRDQPRQLGSTGWLVKPVAAAELVKIIKQVLPGS